MPSFILLYEMPLKFPALGTFLCALFLIVSAFANDSADRGDTRPKPSPSRAPIYSVQVGENGEIFPVFANYASLLWQSDRSFGVVSVTISNHGDTTLRQRIAVQIVGWSDQELQIAELPAGAEKMYLFAPTFLPRFYNNHEIAAATAEVPAIPAVQPAWGTRFRSPHSSLRDHGSRSSAFGGRYVLGQQLQICAVYRFLGNSS